MCDLHSHWVLTLDDGIIDRFSSRVAFCAESDQGAEYVARRRHPRSSLLKCVGSSHSCDWACCSHNLWEQRFLSRTDTHILATNADNMSTFREAPKNIRFSRNKDKID